MVRTPGGTPIITLLSFVAVILNARPLFDKAIRFAVFTKEYSYTIIKIKLHKYVNCTTYQIVFFHMLTPSKHFLNGGVCGQVCCCFSLDRFHVS